MKQTIDLPKWIVVWWLCATAPTFGDGFWMVKYCWDNRQDVPETKLSDFGVDGFLGYARVASMDESLARRLTHIQAKMIFQTVPENVTLQKEKIPETLAEAANYLEYNVCMAYPPVLCVETDEAFYFSGGTSTKPVYDFSSGIAIMKGDGAIWTWNHVEEEEKSPVAE